jgi:hypothetical protein
VPDLHGWITQQIERIEAVAQAATEGPWYADHPEPRHWGDDPESALIVRGKVLCILDNQYGGPLNADHIVLHDPTTVLRRCEADRRILARHRLDPDAIWHEAAMCEGCGTEDEMAYPRTENLNDCPELLDLAHAHGITEEILAALDRPQEGERPEPSGPSLIPDALAEAFGKSMLAAMTTQIIAANTPSPTEKAIKILDPELKKIPGYVPVSEESGPA